MKGNILTQIERPFLIRPMYSTSYSEAFTKSTFDKMEVVLFFIKRQIVGVYVLNLKQLYIFEMFIRNGDGRATLQGDQKETATRKIAAEKDRRF